jgi:nicotinate-nucleotide adenylyltransferase
VSAEEAGHHPRRIGILGGTFDPIHLGHLLLAEETRLHLGLDRVIFIPAGWPWRKTGRTISAAEDRLAMVKMAVASNPFFEVSRIEMDREGPSYTVDTLRALRAQQSAGAEMWFILGSDALMDLPNWNRPDEIVAETRLAVAGREPLTPGDLARVESKVPGLQARLDFVPMPQIGVSSSDLRGRFRQGRSCRYWLPVEVERYVLAHRLYRGPANG